MHPLAAKTPASYAIPRVLGRYEIVGILGRGGMATVYLGRTAGEAGFSRLFAIKVLHPHLAEEEGFVSMLLDEGHIAARLHHPNVVPIVDLGSQGELRYVVLEYVEGCSLSALFAKHRDQRPARVIVPIILDALAGLHAAHTLTDDDGKSLRLVHRDVSPQNVLVGADGAARITDFGVAKAGSSINSTLPGQLKGKIAFMSPEQIRGLELDCRSDIFSAGCLLWSALTGRRLFLGSSDAATMTNILDMPVPPPSTIGLMPPSAFDDICLRALERDRDKRWASAAEMEEVLRERALEHGLLAPRREVAAWVMETFGDELKQRRAAVRAAASRGQQSPAHLDSQPTSSGLRMIPGVGASSTDVEVDVYPGTPSSQKYGAALAPPPPDRRWLIAVGIGVALVAGGLSVWLMMRSPAPPAEPSAPVATAATVATPPVARPPASATAAAKSLPTASSQLASPSPATAPLPAAGPAATNASVAAVPEHPATKGPASRTPAYTWRPATSPKSNPAPQTGGASSSNANSAAWTPDSPLPPP